MTNLTENTPRTFRGSRTLATITASAALYIGSAVEENGSGKLQNATGAGTTFQGFTLEQSSAADDLLQVADSGEVLLSVAKATDWALTDLGATVYLSDGNTFTLTSTSNQAIGKVVEIVGAVGSGVASCLVWVKFEAVARRSI